MKIVFRRSTYLSDQIIGLNITCT